MSETDVELGPVDYLIVEWPKGTQPTGEGLSILGDLVQQGLIRVLDLVFVQKTEDGGVEGLEFANLEGDGIRALMQFEGASSGLIGEKDYDEASNGLEPGTS